MKCSSSVDVGTESSSNQSEDSPVTILPCTQNLILRIIMWSILAMLLMAAPSDLYAEDVSLFDMTLEELMAVRVSFATSLTETADPLKAPASVTIISRDMIRYSGARNLDELLEMYVPNYYSSKQGGNGPHHGMRGIMSANDKMLLLVNGRVMNHKGLVGNMSERHMPLLGDISSIEVVRGPGSAIFGPGAIAGVISIQTLTASTFEGSEVHVRQGIVEEFSYAEMKMGHRLSDDAGLFLYLGLGDYPGTRVEDSPLVFSKDSDIFSAGERIKDPNLPKDNSARNGRPHHKAHLHFQWKDLQIWARSTRSSIQFANLRQLIELDGSFETSIRSVEYHQWTLAAQQKLNLSDQLSLTLNAGYDVFDLILDQNRLNPPDYEYVGALREKELSFRTLLCWDINEIHALAGGIEYAYEWFGEDPSLLTADSVHLGGGDDILPPWSTETYSLFGEYKCAFNQEWTAFLGGRADHHTINDWMYSPRMAVVFTPDQKNQFKLTTHRSVRKNNDWESKRAYDRDQERDIETINSIEVRHDRQVSKRLSHGLALFHYSHKILGFVREERRVTHLGETDTAGIELELKYKTDNHTMSLSHCYTKLLDMDLRDDKLDNQSVTSQPYGYGHDLQNWPNHITKADWHWLFADDWRLDSSLYVYWAYPGAEDYTAYNNEVIQDPFRSLSDGRTEAFRTSAFLNTGVSYQANDNLRLALNLHNILGWIDEDLNKRNLHQRLAGYRLAAPAASMGLEMNF